MNTDSSPPLIQSVWLSYNGGFAVFTHKACVSEREGMAYTESTL